MFGSITVMVQGSVRFLRIALVSEHLSLVSKDFRNLQRLHALSGNWQPYMCDEQAQRLSRRPGTAGSSALPSTRRTQQPPRTGCTCPGLPVTQVLIWRTPMCGHLATFLLSLETSPSDLLGWRSRATRVPRDKNAQPGLCPMATSPLSFPREAVKQSHACHISSHRRDMSLSINGSFLQVSGQRTSHNDLIVLEVLSQPCLLPTTLAGR